MAWAEQRLRQLAGGPPNTTRATNGNSWTPSMMALQLPLPGPEEITEPYRENVWVRIALGHIRERVNQIPFAVWDRPPSDQSATTLPKHPVMELLRRPNALMQKRQLFDQHIINYKLDGESFWFLFGKDGKPLKVNHTTGLFEEAPSFIQPVRGSFVEHLPDENGHPLFWRYQLAHLGSHVTSETYSDQFHRAAVLTWQDYDPYNPVRGLGAIEAAMWEIQLYYSGQRYIAASLQNGGNPGGWVTFNQVVDAGELTRRQAQLDESYGPDHNGRWHLIDKQATVTPNPVRPRDMEYRSLLEYQRDLILALLKVPSQIAGVSDKSTFNNMETAERLFWQGTVWDLAAMTAEVIEERLIRPARNIRGWQLPPEGGAAFNPRGIKFLELEQTDRITAAVSISQAGVGVSFNQALEVVGAEVPKLEGPGPDTQWVNGANRTYEQAKKEADLIIQGKLQPKQGPLAPKGTDQPAKKDQVEKPKKKAKPDKNALARLVAQDDSDDVLRRRFASWFVEFERAQQQLLVEISRGGELQLDDPSDGDELFETFLALTVLDIEEWAERLLEKTGPSFRRIFRDALRQALSESGGSFLGLDHPAVLRWLSSVPPQITEGYTSALARQIATLIQRTLAQHEAPIGSVQTLRERIRAHLPELQGNLARAFKNNEQRAMTIARTETGRVQNGARWLQYEHAGVAEIEWITREDDVVRSTHVPLHGMRRLLGATFPNGLRYPHDPNGDISEVANCRCRFIATKYEDDDE